MGPARKLFIRVRVHSPFFLERRTKGRQRGADEFLLVTPEVKEFISTEDHIIKDDDKDG